MATLNIKNLPDRLYRKLQTRARQQHRSIAQEVTHILAEALKAPETRSILALRGLGKEHWTGIDASRHVDAERRSWDIYFIEEHPAFLRLVEPIFAAVDAGRLTAFTSSLTLLEVLVVPYGAGNLPLADRYQELLTGSRGVRLSTSIGRSCGLPRTSGLLIGA